MIKKALILALVAIIPLHSSYAFYGWIMPPYGKEYQPGEATEVFLIYDEGIQTIVLKPEWQGNMKEFGMVYPVPSKPTVKAGPANLFWELDEATNPYIQPPVVYAEARDEDSAVKAAAESVTVVEESQVAEYKVTILKATSATSLTSWLKKNGYNYTKEDTNKVKYYVDKGDFYFVALKVDASHFEEPVYRIMEDAAEPSGSGSDTSEGTKIALAPDYWWWGELTPVEISFATDKPQLPMRTLKSQKNDMTFDLYTLGEKAIYIPGVDTVWSGLVDSALVRQVPSLASYDAKAKWLVRQEVKFVPANSNEDLFLTLAETEDFTTVTAGKQVRFNPKLLDSKTGIVPGTRGQVVGTDGKGNAYAFGRSLTIGSTGEDVRALQQLLNAEGFMIAKTGPGSSGNESAYFGSATKAALIKYQNYYRSDIGIAAGTGYFGPMTIKFVNR